MAARGSQSNTMLYSLITFVGLFVIATVCAVIFYIKAEDSRSQFQAQQGNVDKIASVREQTALNRIVGRTESGQSYMGTAMSLVNKLYKAITGQDPSEEIPADVRVNEAVMQINAVLAGLGQDGGPTLGADGISLLGTIKDLKQKLDASRTQMQQLQAAYTALENDLDQTKAQLAQRQTLFLSELQTSQSLADEIRGQFDQLKEQTRSATDEQIQSYRDRLESEQARLRQGQLEMQEADRKMRETESLLDQAMAKLEAIKPKPDVKVTAFNPDARIVRVDLQNGLVTLDIGAADHVYRGLTFAVYQGNLPIPEDGQGKAEIEVFQVGQQVSVARIIRTDKRNPIVPEDLVVNLIWDAKTNKQFIVIGDFDINGDGKVDPDGSSQVKELIERWGGTIQENVTIDTDFVVMGNQPVLPQRPTQDELDADPTALQRYESAAQRAKMYNDFLAKAGNLRIPTFSYRQFIYLIGYDTLSSKLSAN
jgi:outer membrane murein-binding lipoprotein Lpp